MEENRAGHKGKVMNTKQHMEDTLREVTEPSRSVTSLNSGTSSLVILREQSCPHEKHDTVSKRKDSRSRSRGQRDRSRGQRDRSRGQRDRSRSRGQRDRSRSRGQRDRSRSRGQRDRSRSRGQRERFLRRPDRFHSRESYDAQSRERRDCLNCNLDLIKISGKQGLIIVTGDTEVRRNKIYVPLSEERLYKRRHSKDDPIYITNIVGNLKTKRCMNKKYKERRGRRTRKMCCRRSSTSSSSTSSSCY